ncbi:MAG: glycosyltransferase [Bacteroidota bacterium]
MISLIICSRKTSISGILQKNIESTIGAEYEIVVINNSKNELSIFEAYNIGVSKSIGDVLCFMHDDILYHTNNWGKKVYAHLKDDLIGAIGIAGSPFIGQLPGSWWANELVNQQIAINKNGLISNFTKFSDGIEETSKPVVTLDGVWMCVKKELFNQISFDKNTFTGYHFYDIDLCLQIFQLNYKICAVFDIQIEHFSAGKVNEQWINSALLLNSKWSKNLPLQSMALTKSQKLQAEVKTLKEFIRILISNRKVKSESYFFAIKQLLKRNKNLPIQNKAIFISYYILKYINAKLHSN